MHPSCTATAAVVAPGHPPLHANPRWYRGAIVSGRRTVLCAVPHGARHSGRPSLCHAPRALAPRALALGVAAASALLAGGCGGGARQDAHEAAGAFPMEIVHASFPASQSIARQTSFELQVRNTGSRTVPDVAVTVDSFNYTSHYPELAANKRPVWVIERGPGAIAQPPVESQEISPPGGGQTAYVNTWAFGSLAPGRTRTFVWRVVPVKAGTYTVHFAVAAGLAGKAKAVSDPQFGGPPHGALTVQIAPAPAKTHVEPSTGRVAPGRYPTAP